MTISTCPIAGCTTRDDLGNPLLISTPLCETHRAKVATAIRRMPRLYAELHLALAPAQTNTIDTDQISRSKNRPLGIVTEARALQENLLIIALGAEACLIADRGWVRQRRRGREGPTLLAASRFVEHYLDAVLELRITLTLDEHRIPFHDAVLDTARAGRLLLGQNNPPIRLKEPCPSCDCRSLERANGASEVRCTYQPCGRVFSEDEYDRLVLILTSGGFR